MPQSNISLKPEALLFDLGGVIMDIERMRCVEAFTRLGMKDINSLLGDYGQKGFFLALEEGKISADEFRAEARKHLPEGVTDQEINEAFNAFLVGIPVERLSALEELRRQGYHIYMLSNTNPIMWNSKIAEEFRKAGKDINHYFNGCLTSFDAKICKPDARIFREAISRFNLNPATTLFFDDSESNCRAAAELGFQTATVYPGTEFIDIMSEKYPA